ncbi:zymogen granule membrane protein 16-like [Rana temporaria]|uniref:zymogen granule membrane protein 16-like n=1 Tax=Rana temporaria TaxID=8407 RepID=UPI001AADB70D|nr:zymogen granule membrane protein 16-like [Rana temporaria]
MLTLLCVCFLLGSTAALSVQSQPSSFSGEFGTGGGTAFSFSSEQRYGQITGFRIRETTTNIVGIQLQYGDIWGPFYGYSIGTLFEVLLFRGENITQVSGKYGSVNELVFVTSRGRIFKFGQPAGTSFNDFPLFEGTVLRYISGRYAPNILTSIGFHWGTQPSCYNCKDGSK